MKRTLLQTVSAVGFAALLFTSAPALAVEYTDAEIKAYIDAHAGDPAAIAAKMKETGVSIDRIQKAGGYTDEQIGNYVNSSNNTALQQSLTQSIAARNAAVTDTQVNDYIRANLNDPAKIADAMAKYNVGLDRIQQATGYSRDEMSDYIGASKDPNLKNYLENWQTAPVNPAYANLPDYMKGTSGGQPAAVIRDASDIDKLPIWASMHPTAAADYKAKLLASLSGSNDSGGSYLMGINGFQISIPGRNDPQHEYPPMSAKDLNALKDKLKGYADSGAAVQKNLVDCVQSGKEDCTSERQAHALMRATVSDLQAQISAAEADKRIRATTDPEKKMMASVDASINAQNAYLACTAAASQTGSNCSAQAELAKKQLENMKTSSRAVVDKCISDFGAASANCTPLYAQAHAQESDLNSFKEKVAAFEKKTGDAASTNTVDVVAKEPPVTITIPATGEKTLTDGHTINAQGVIKDAAGKVVGKVTDAGKLVDASGKALGTATTRQLIDLFQANRMHELDQQITDSGAKLVERDVYTALNKDLSEDLNTVDRNKLLNSGAASTVQGPTPKLERGEIDLSSIGFKVDAQGNFIDLRTNTVEAKYNYSSGKLTQPDGRDFPQGGNFLEDVALPEAANVQFNSQKDGKSAAYTHEIESKEISASASAKMDALVKSVTISNGYVSINETDLAYKLRDIIYPDLLKQSELQLARLPEREKALFTAALAANAFKRATASADNYISRSHQVMRQNQPVAAVTNTK